MLDSKLGSGKSQTLFEVLSGEERVAAREVFRGFLRHATLELLCDVMTEEVSYLCGRKHHPDPNSSFFRGGSAPGVVQIDGSERPVIRPRVRTRQADGSTREKELRSYRLSQDSAALKARVLSALEAGASSRDASKAASASGQRGTSKSHASRLWEQAGRKFIDQLRSRDFSQEDWVVLILDGIRLAKDLWSIVAVGVTTDGEKRVLDFEIGASENELAASELTERLCLRGFRGVQGGCLFCVLDGSKALRSAVLKQFPDADIQRCLVHKERNLKRCLSKKHWGKVSDFFRELRLTSTLRDAKSVVTSLRSFLSKTSSDAFRSLEEAGEDLIRFWEVGAPEILKKTLLSTNIIENSMRNTRRKIGRVSRWHPETDQPHRWMAYALVTIEKGFRRVSGYTSMGELVAALLAHRKEKEKKKRANPPLDRR